MSFKSFQFHSQIESGIGSFGYRVPTPIQLQCIPLILEGKDVMGPARFQDATPGTAIYRPNPQGMADIGGGVQLGGWSRRQGPFSSFRVKARRSRTARSF
jgi:hypothetical protein